MSTVTESNEESSGSSRLQVSVAILFGAILALVGLAAPLVAGPEGNLLIFGRNYLHDGIHLVSGAAGLVAGYTGGTYADKYNKSLGIVYLLVTILGFAFFGVFAELIALNAADNLLHLALAGAFLVVGFGVGLLGFRNRTLRDVVGLCLLGFDVVETARVFGGVADRCGRDIMRAVEICFEIGYPRLQVVDGRD
jgi:hypothetical protein